MPKSNMPKHAERRNMPEGPHLCMQMTNFTWLTRCSGGWVVCMLEMFSAKTSLTIHWRLVIVVVVVVTLSSAMSATSSWAKATKTEQQERHDERDHRTCRNTILAVRLCHAQATPATQSAAASRAPKPVQARHPVPWVPRLPRETKVDVRLCHACHAKCRGVTGAQASPSAPPSAMSATPATQNDGGCEFVPRLPRETKVDVRLWHACHAKCRGVTGAQASPSAPPSAICTTPATLNDGGCEFVPRLPRETKVDVRLCHACHVKRQ